MPASVLTPGCAQPAHACALATAMWASSRTCNYCTRRHLRTPRRCHGCGAPFADTRRGVAVVLRLGSRSMLVPPFLIIKNDNQHPIEITSMTIDDAYTLRSAMRPFTIPPDRKVHIDVSNFTNRCGDTPLAQTQLALQLPYSLIVDGCRVNATTLDWMAALPGAARRATGGMN